MERIRKEIAEYRWEPESLKTAVSAGVAEYRENESAEEFLKRSDDLLYDAKENGRNRIKF